MAPSLTRAAMARMNVAEHAAAQPSSSASSPSLSGLPSAIARQLTICCCSSGNREILSSTVNIRYLRL